MIGRDCPSQTGPKDSILKESKIPGYFMAVTENEGCCVNFCPRSHLCVDYDKKCMQRLRESLAMETF